VLRDPERRAGYDRLHQRKATTTEARSERRQARSAPHHDQPPLRAGPVVWRPGPM
jgi:hypothetical protein